MEPVSNRAELKPEVASLAERVMVGALRYQPFAPSGVIGTEMVGATGSSLATRLAFRLVSPQVETAQADRDELPSAGFQAQLPLAALMLQKVLMAPLFTLPSTREIVSPGIGSFTRKVTPAPPRHQPALPGLSQVELALMLAGG